MKLLTYNIWFDSYYMEERMIAICQIILEKDVDFVALQEVTKKSLYFLHYFLDGKYYFSKDKIDKEYDDIILSKHKIIEYYHKKFPITYMDREYNYIISEIDGKIIKIVNIHLESDYWHSYKYQQLKYIFDQIKDEDNVFIMGDTNIPDTKIGNKIKLPFNMKDAWIDDGQKIEIKYTYDYLRNSCIKGKYRSRIDRVFMKNNWNINKFELIGTKEIIDKIYPSDHFGIYLEVQLLK